MELNIPDLLDGLQENTIPIQPCSDASADRIKELTMKKVHKYEKPRKRTLSFVSKLLVATMLIAALAIPVMAATGFRLTDWLEGLNKSDLTEYRAHYESWENTEGFWQVALTARDVTREGMTLNVREVQDSPVTGKLEIHGDWWLEQWNGESFIKMAPSAPVAPLESREIRDGDGFEVTVNWADTYGQLESGRYRFGRDFTYSYSDGRTCRLTDWAEFRIFNEDMTPYIEQCKAALDELLNRKNSHISLDTYGYASPNEVTDLFSYEIWRNGDDYFLTRSMEDYRENRTGRWGELLLGNVGISINSWVNDDILQGADDWEYDHLLAPDLNSFDLWHFCLSANDSQVGEIWVEGNTIALLCAEYPEPDIAIYSEHIFRFDDSGRLVEGEKWYLPDPSCTQEEKWINCRMTVHDTPVDEVARVIDAQNVGEPFPFSWEQEKQEQLKKSDVKTTGFANTTPVTIQSGYDVFMHGFGDYDVIADTHHTSRVSYDASADMWKVEYMWANGDIHATIYMNGQGITQLTVMEPYEE